ncbi:polysaccharide deacetylase family protein [Halococcus salsus]|uniref:polysaccharide deacetylase family protein n=1 Tax=Halococcus salsus TaxID=2162894 RepID=UPI001356E0C2|nr:polysaccharide deacetylase family protein [Halococcus salsus]
MKGLLTVDVEGGSKPNVYQCVDILERFLDEIEIPATLFVTPDVVENRPETVAKWLDQPHSVGLHIHPERIGPGDSDWLAEYDEESIEEMVAIGCETFDDYLGFKPVQFRAGRWEYSEQLLRALQSQGFERDASLRSDSRRDPYERSGIREFPMTVYDSAIVRQLLRPWTIDSIPLHADAFLGKRAFIPGFYAVTWRLFHADIPYLMTSLHDYDVGSTAIRSRIKQYLTYVFSRTSPTVIDDRYIQ